ncbi:hypothetical protein HDU76_003577 [Blyttiomyces sp. JEL0837]|nr:hypothetical protein HDU76_003577 [Blyttiomyces sp. JEL0837]
METTRPFDPTLINWFGSEVGKVGGILELTIEPISDITQFTDAVLDSLAQSLYKVNTQYGIPILLRFAHEMNGDWTLYGNKPIQYIAAFRQMAGHVRKYTNMTAMVWAPNIGMAYPFVGGGVSESPTAGDNFDLLDTNKNGRIDFNDDPYGPFYPGDDYVDWVGLSLYYYPFVEGNNTFCPPTYFQDNMNGYGDVVNDIVSPSQQSATFKTLHAFYQRFAAGKNKPMLLPESGSPFFVGQTPYYDEKTIKMGWWDQVLSDYTLQNYPLLQVVVNFEEAKSQNGFVRDWTLTNHTEILNKFSQKLVDFGGHLVEGTKLKFACDGSVEY